MFVFSILKVAEKVLLSREDTLKAGTEMLMLLGRQSTWHVMH